MRMERCLETLTEYPVLLHHEDAIAKQPYAVTDWILYLDALDDLCRNSNTSNSNKSKTSSTLDKLEKQKDKVLQTEEQIYQLKVLRDWVGKRALHLLPRSYKLWKNHWEFVVMAATAVEVAKAASGTVDTDHDTDPQNPFAVSSVMELFERAVLTLHAYPRVWMAYFDYLQNHPGCVSVTVLRRTINRALQAVAMTQHDKLWSLLVPFLSDTGSKGNSTTTAAEATAAEATATEATNTTIGWSIPVETRVQILQRFVLLDASYRSTLAAFLQAHGKPGQSAACLYQRLLVVGTEGAGNTTTDDSNSAASDWQAFTDLVTQHSVKVEQAGVPWETILRAALAVTTSKSKKKGGSDVDVALAQQQDSMQQQQLQGLLWTQLADAWIRRGAFDTARTVYEEGLQTVGQVRDFSIVYDAYLLFEEGLLEAAVASLEDMEDDMEEAEDETDNADNDDWDILLGSTAHSKLADMELAVARAEHLTARRPLLLNQVLLRQNPHNVGEWLQRADLYLKASGTGTNASTSQAGQAAACLEDALRTVQSGKAVNGMPSQLVTTLLTIYEDEASLHNPAAARDLMDRMCHQVKYAFSKSDDWAECWAAWVEFELRQEKYDDALGLARQAVASNSAGGFANRQHLNLCKSLRLWDLLLDLEESLGTVQTTKDAYNRALEIKAATVQHVLNYASFLVEQKYFEESFTVYERGLELFAFPHVGAKLLWKAYLKTFTDRYNGTKVERTRDLYQRCLETCPPEESAEFFMSSGDFEEEYGLTKRALSVYRAMCHKVPASEKLVAYELFIHKTIKYLGLTATRDIYQEAIEALDDKAAANMSLDFSKMETSLQQIDRARAILAYGAQLADPRRLPEYWKTWNEFEIAHGNEETFREMLRVKRSVEAAFSTVNYNATGMTEKVENLSNEEAMRMIAGQEGVEVKKSATAVSGFVPGKRTAAVASLDDVEQRVAKLRKATGAIEATATDANQEEGDDDDEIDIDDIDAEIEEAAAEGAATAAKDISAAAAVKDVSAAAAVKDVSTKSVPAGVFGGLVSQTDK
jgi:pre-mRNA-splicing factor SYF1